MLVGLLILCNLFRFNSAAVLTLWNFATLMRSFLVGRPAASENCLYLRVSRLIFSCAARLPSSSPDAAKRFARSFCRRIRADFLADLVRYARAHVAHHAEGAD